MSHSLFSENWYRVAELKPKLRSHAEFVKHNYRGEDWYIALDHSTGKSQRFTVEAYLIIQLMNGKRTLEAIWQKACEHLEDDMPSQDEIINLLRQLHTSGLLLSDSVPDIRDMHERYAKEKRNKVLQYLKSPLSIKIPLFDPESLLKKTEAWFTPLFSRVGGLIWLAVVIYGVVLATKNWEPLTNNFSDRVFAADSLIILLFVYPLIKLIHEFGHAFAVKRWGGEVHELGLMFLVFIPVPYVDASASSAYANKYKRMLVGASGILVEVFLAALAMIVWVEIEPGFLRSVLFNIMLVGGVSTVLFNGNPLLRFDAYYVLADWLEIPNLGAKSGKHVAYCAKKTILRLSNLDPIAKTRREAVWLFCYSVASYIYRMIIMVTIALFVASKFFFIGVLLALWSVSNVLVTPLFKIVKFLKNDPQVQRKQTLLYLWLFGGATVFGLILFVVPFPLLTVSQGVLWAPEKTQIYAKTDCFVKELRVPQRAFVKDGEILIICDMPELERDVKLAQAQLREYEGRHRAVAINDRTEGLILKDEIHRTREELARAQEQLDELRITSPVKGKAFIQHHKDLVGTFIRRGTLLGYVLEDKESMARVVVTQDSISFVRNDVRKIEARLADDIAQVVDAKIIRQVPAATHKLPSVALSTVGGGDIVLDPSDKEGASSFEGLFIYDIGLPGIYSERIGEKVYVRFHHQPEPLAYRLFRAIRRLFLSKLAV